MLDSNERYQEFRRALDARGVDVRFAWQAKRNPKSKHCDVHFLLFNGRGFQPKILTAIIIDYGARDGFGLYLDDAAGRSIEQDADAIAGRRPADPFTTGQARNGFAP